MKRRQFIEFFSKFSLLAIFYKSPLVYAIPAGFWKGVRHFQRDFINIVSMNGKDRSRLELVKYYGISYVRAQKLAKALGLHTYINEEKKKIVIYFPQNKVLVTANNPFVVIDNRTFQLPVQARWIGNNIYLPLDYFLPLINKYCDVAFTYDFNENLLKLVNKLYNITDLTIENRENGTVIRIKTSRRFGEGEITMDMRYGWLHVDLYQGKVDKQRIAKVRPVGLVREVKVFQFEKLVSIGLRLRKEPLSKEIFQDKITGDVVVVLRTREKLASKDESDAGSRSDALDEDMRSQLEEEKKRWLIDTIVIDAGHGGKDPGAIGYKNLYEKDVVLAIALKLGKMIEKQLKGVRVVYTRKGDNFVPLRRRTQIANESNAKLFVSIHANWSPNRRASGFETYILGPEKGDRAREVVLKENAVIKFEDADSQKGYEGINMILATMAQSAFMRQSEHLASLVQEEMTRRLRSINLKGRGVKQGPFWVMVGASMPSILVETGFITNPYEARVLRTHQYQRKIAEGIFEGIKRFKEDYESAI